jgi:hypothetical protein
VTQPVKKYPAFLWNPKVHYRVHNSPPLVTILNQMHLDHIFPPYSPKIHSNIIPHLRIDCPSGLFPSCFRITILYAFLISLMCATCVTHLLLLVLITLILCGVEYAFWSSSLCTLFSNTLNLCSPLSVKIQVSHPYKTTGKIIVLCAITGQHSNISEKYLCHYRVWRRGLGIFLFTTVSGTALGPTQLPIQWVPGAVSLGVKRLGREASYSPPSSDEVKNAWSYTLTPQYVSWRGG